MQRLAFSTIPCDGWSLDETVDMAKQYGFQGLELREGNVWGISVEMTKDERSAVLRKVEEAGLRVIDIGSGVCLTGSEGDAAQLMHFCKVVSLAQDLKASGVRIFLGYFRNRRDEQVPAIPYAELVAYIRQACDYAATTGVQVWIETHNEFSTGRALRTLLDDVDRPNCAVIYDLIHPLEEGESPADTLALLGSQCVHIHIKDGVPFEDQMELNWKYTKVGEGKIPVASIVGMLESAGYTGYYSLEWETKWRKELQVPGMEPAIIFPAYADFMRMILKSLKK
ncbi:sugar phosphate isomerase/epimerase family protein [Paenibacillus contaminans]|nr:sugar phosphate isomerase/epimerase family protein [Paenibacillus contaminans]